MEATQAAAHVRDNSGLTANLERRCLIWLADRMPPWVNSDHLTVLGLLGMMLGGLGFWVTRVSPAGLLLVLLGLSLNWFGDSLDGTLARRRNHQRPRYGFYVDHVVDIFGTFFLLSGLACSSIMTPWVAIGVMLVYFMLASETFLATHTIGVFRMAHWRLGPTELRLLLAVGLVRCWFQPVVTIAGATHYLFDVGGVIAIIGLSLTLLASVARNTYTLYRAERISR